MRLPLSRRLPFRPNFLLPLIAAGALAASPPVPGKRGPQAPHYGGTSRAGSASESVFRAGVARAPLQSAQTMNVLAIRVSFSDTKIDSTTAYFDRLLLFMHQYWNQVSDGQVVLNSTLWDSVFTLPRTMAYYGDDDHFQERLVYLVRDMVAVADSTVDFRPYQSVVIFHAGQGQEADVFDNSRAQLWSAFVTPDDFEQILPDPLTGGVGIPTNDAISPGVFYHLKEAVEVPESESQDGYRFGEIGVLVHELGHQIGRILGQSAMPDLYDTTPDEGGYSQGLGSWDVMAGGVWNANGFVPAGPSAWTRLWLGFIVSTSVTSSGPQTLSQLESQVGSNPRALRIPITQSEYFLLENRQHDLDGDGKFTFDDVNQDGCFDFYTDSYAGAEFDFFLPSNLIPPGGGCDAGTYQTGSGVIIYHVDDSKIEAGLASNVVEGDTQRKGIDVEEADGIEDLDGPPTSLSAGSADDVFRTGWRNRFTPDTTPSTAAYSNVRTGIAVTNIGVSDSVMAMDVTIDRSRAGWPKVLTGRIRNSPSLAADLNDDGVLELIVPVQRLNNSGAIYVFRPDGNDFLDGDAAPTPFATIASAPTSSPCVGDIDGAPGAELVFQTLNGAIYAYHANGVEVMDGDADPLTQGVLVSGSSLTATHSQPILVDLNGDDAMEIVVGSTGTAAQLGGSALRVVSLAGGLRQVFRLPMGGSTDRPPAAADLSVPPDGFPEVIIANVGTVGGEYAASGLSIANWEILNDGALPKTPDSFGVYLVQLGGPYSAPVLADLDRDGAPEIVVADASGAFHAFRLQFGKNNIIDPGKHNNGDPPSDEVQVNEITGWPVAPLGRGRLSEISLGDLENDGFPEVLHTGDQVRIAAFHYNGAPRAGYPISAAAPFAVADTAGWWPPLVADVDGDGIRDVIAILPDGRRPAYRADGSAIREFVELGSTGSNAPPMLIDLDADDVAEWVETYDSSPTQISVAVRDTWTPVAASGLVWTQYRNSPTRNAAVAAGPAGTGGGTRNLTAVYGYPNPSRTGISTIHYRLDQAATSVSIRILDTTGSTIAELPVNSANLAGSAEHAVPWDHTSVASGVYLCRVEVRSSRGSEIEFARLAVIR